MKRRLTYGIEVESIDSALPTCVSDSEQCVFVQQHAAFDVLRFIALLFSVTSDIDQVLACTTLSLSHNRGAS